MSAFLDFFDGRQVGWRDGRPIWLTLTRLRWRRRDGRVVLIPEEFYTDLASVPRVPFAYWIAGGRGIRSSLSHDFAYQFGYYLLEDGSRLLVDRPEADEDFRVSLIDDPISGAGRAMAATMYGAVRTGGGFVWRRRSERTPRLNPIWASSWGIQAA